ncbi:unnamed protein product [Colias eurytheme]|nr:unnamed protein product [Colias eurytheme]
MERKRITDRDIEDYLSQLEDGYLSEDGNEEDENDFEQILTTAELRAVLEDNEQSEPVADVQDPSLIEDPPLIEDPALIDDPVPGISNNTTSSSQPIRDNIDVQRLIWKKQSLIFQEDNIRFQGCNDFPASIMTLETPFQFFSYYFTPDFISNITEESNRYSVQKQPDRPDCVTDVEIRKYMGILIFMSVYHYPNVRSYWHTKFGFRPISEAMPVNRFEKIRRIIHFNNNDMHKPINDPNHDKLHKLRPVIDHLNEKFSSIPLDQRLSIDEQMCATKIRHFMKQYLPLKPHKWGFKLFMLCSLMGYAYKFIIYSGKDNEPMLENETDVGTVGNVVIKLSRAIPRTMNHIVYFDNFYTSLPLMYYLAKQGIWCLGTVQRNRLGKSCKLPTKQQVMAKSVERGSYEEYVTSYNGIEMSSVSWKDNRQVTLLSTYVGAEPVSTIERYDKVEKRKKFIQCPKVVKEYNAHMGGVDLMDSYLGRYRIRMKRCKLLSSIKCEKCKVFLCSKKNSDCFNKFHI